ncbi:MAG: N-acyl homoserine lactonase family protein [Proteobacteria bacterium]|jgi:N-acyl homoserine lactone hydrolase|nr:N-acyl homoserine lactonase family protein [Pseudomonadota bacterium]
MQITTNLALNPGWAAFLCAAFTLAGCGSQKPPTAAASPETAPAGPRLYILDCGTIAPMDPALFSLKKEEVKGDGSFVSPCYLIVHPKGTLVWDVGQVPDAKIRDDGTEAVEQDILKATRRLGTQLAALGHPIEGITHVAMSHYHTDHTANANAFAKATWIVQQAEYDLMFKDAEVGIRTPDTYRDLRDAKRITLNNADHDVFGDGTVVVMAAPGHTPGHQMLFVKLARTGPVLLEGDLYHFPEERTLDRVPTFDFDAAMTRATRVKVEQFLKDSGAQMWIQHDPPTYAGLKKAPEFYD